MSPASRRKKRGYTTTPNVDTHLGSELSWGLVRVASGDTAQANSPAHDYADLLPLLCGLRSFGASNVDGEVMGDIHTQALAGSMETFSGISGSAESFVLVFKPGKELVESGVVRAVHIVGQLQYVGVCHDCQC